MIIYEVSAWGRPKGRVRVSHNLWIWERPNMGVDTFPKGTTVLELKDYIARRCLVDVTALSFRRKL